MRKWQDIDGWLTQEEGDALQRYARGYRVLEIGAWKGRSTVCLAYVAQLVVTVDHFRGDGGTGYACTRDELLDNVEDLHNVVVVEAEMRHVRLHGFFGMAYVDGAHDFVSVTRDLSMVRGIRPSVLAMHDWGLPDVKAAARSFRMPEPDHVHHHLAVWEGSWYSG